MFNTTRVAKPAVALVLIAGLYGAISGSPARGEQPAPVPGILTDYVPADSFLVFGHIETPEREFVRRHWDRVFNAISACGFTRELRLATASAMPAEQRAAFEKKFDQITEIFRSVHWRDMVARELVIAERFKSIMPEVILLARPAPETLDANVQGLAKLLKTVVDMNTDGELVYSEQEVAGVRIWALEVSSAPVGFYLLHRGEVVSVVLGKSACQDVRDLLSGLSSASSMSRNARFRAALAEVPRPEHTYGFVDFARLFSVLPQYPKMIMGLERKRAASHDAPGEVGAVESNGLMGTNGPSDPHLAGVELRMKFFTTVVEQLNIFDYSVVSGTMEGRQEVSHTLLRIRSDAHDMPVYRLVAGRKPFEAYHRYLPVETTAFSVSSGIDLAAAYRLALDLVRDGVPEGPEYCAKWAQLQRDWDFNVEEDLLNWVSGETVSVVLPQVPPNPLGGDDGVLLIRVTDRERARGKLDAGLKRMAEFLTQQGQPLALSAATDVPVEGFQRVTHPLLATMLVQPCIGVWEDWIVIGGSARSISMVMETAAGKHDSILKNERFRRDGVVADGPVVSASFTDLSKTGQEVNAMLMGAGFAAAAIPDQPETRPIKAVIRSLSSLGPVVNEINFFSSSSEATTFADDAWRTTARITYVDPPASSVSR